MKTPYLTPEQNIAVTTSSGFVEMIPAMAIEAVREYPERPGEYCLVVRTKGSMNKKDLIPVSKEEGIAATDLRSTLPLFTYMREMDYHEPKFPAMLPPTTLQSWVLHYHRAYVALLESLQDPTHVAKMGGNVWVPCQPEGTDSPCPLIFSESEYEELKAMWLAYKGLAKEKASEE